MAKSISFLFCSIALCGSAVASASLVGHWAADGNFTDSVNANNGSSFGSVSFVAGHSGQAFGFSGNGGIDVPDSSAYAFGTGDFSVAYWVSFSSIGSQLTGMVSKDNYNANPYNGWLFNNDSGDVGFLTRHSWNGSTRTGTNESGFTANTWYHLAGVRESGTIKFYVNGVLASSANGSNWDVTNNGMLHFGYLQPAAPQYMSGALDDIRIYSHALSTGEIEALNGVPEPITIVSLLGGLGLLARRRRQR